jgi:hypothetical protein
MSRNRTSRKILQLTWWNISGYVAVSPRTLDAKYERRGWFGMTTSDTSDLEYLAIVRWCDEKNNNIAADGQRKSGCDNVYRSPRIWFEEGSLAIGSYRTYCNTYWFKTEELRNEFDNFLKSLVVRNWARFFSRESWKAACPKIQDIIGRDYHVIVGSEAVAFSAYINDEDLSLLELIL